MKKTNNNIFLFILWILFTQSVSAQKIKIGSKMPNFELMDQYSEYFETLDYKGKKALIIFFYIEDGSPICTREVIAFNEKLEDIKKLDAMVVGINPASILDHRRFVIKLGIKYPILFDRNNDVQKMFRVSNYKKTKSPQRVTFVVDKEGVIRKIFHSDDNAEIHVIEALKTLEDL